MKAKINLKNIRAFIVGWVRYYLYYSRFKFLIRKHIQEQIDFRIKFMQKECYENGVCVICGCATTALQMADKSCDKPCYPPMMNKNKWGSFYYRMWSYADPHKGLNWFFVHKTESDTLSFREFNSATREMKFTKTILNNVESNIS